MKNVAEGLKAELKEDGYSQEEKYFYEVNKALIERRRKLLDDERLRKQAETLRSLHWMKCPKCGSDLRDNLVLGVRLEQCPSCQGVFLDQGELETILQAKRSHTFLHRLKKFLGPRDESPVLF